METKKQMQQIANYSLKCFMKMFQEGGTYKEVADRNKKYFKIIKYYFAENKVSVSIPMSKNEYSYWRKIKPSLRQESSINEK